MGELCQGEAHVSLPACSWRSRGPRFNICGANVQLVNEPWVQMRGLEEEGSRKETSWETVAFNGLSSKEIKPLWCS